MELLVSNLEPGESDIFIAVFNTPETFLTENMVYSKIIRGVNSEMATCTFEIPPGEYAIAVFQDQNFNGELDRNWVFYPKEPFGMSNDYKPAFRAPLWTDAAVQLKGSCKVSISLN